MTDYIELWNRADWVALSEVELDYTSDDFTPELIAYKAAGYFNLHQLEIANRLFKLAIQKGCEISIVKKLLFSGMHFSLGRVEALKSNIDAQNMHFDKGVAIANFVVGSELNAHFLNVKEISSIGLLPQATELLTLKKQELKSELNSEQNQNTSIESSLVILESEIEIINHELMLAYQKNQLYSQINQSATLNHADGSVNIERLKKLSPSQLGQDLWVLKQTNYKEEGFFVEFGATNGILLSNSYLLENEFGWRGICAEPNPKYFSDLKVNRDCTISDNCIADKTGKTVEFILANEYGGISDYVTSGSHSEKVEAYSQHTETINIETISLHDFLIKYNAPKEIDYISIDTEGSEFEILSSFPFNEWDVKLFTIEHNYTELRDKIYSLLTQNGYKRMKSDWDDWYYK